ncbi:hypothetical protein CL633_02685 [bacterium]|nr:hypothetical protein [bacterium]|tara:strand:- start:2308 stop:4686 length:2379 start_codon:yes stop_codon:yes gene_type:complete
MRKLLVFAVLLLLAVVFIFGNIIAKKGGALDNANLNKDDPYYKMGQHVRSKAPEGFEPNEFVIFVLHFPNGINSKDDLEQALDFNEKLEQEFRDRVLSLAQIPNYKDTGEELLDKPYLNAGIDDIAEWKRRVKKSKYYGVFAGQDFRDLKFTIFLESGYDEIQEFRRIVEFLEERKIPWHEWWYKKDIYPVNPNIGVAGWVVGRGLIDLATTVDILTLVTLGLLFSFPIFILSLRSWKQAAIATLGIVFMSLIWTRGSIGIMQYLGIDIKERVYLLLAYANCIVQGVSFSLHKFESINKKTKVNWLIGIAAAIAIGSFATLYWFQVLAIRELGVISAIGVGFLFILAVIFLPTMNSLFKAKPKPEKQTGKITQSFDWIIRKTVNACTFAGVRLSFAGALAIVLGLVIIAGLLVLDGHLIIRTKPLEFIQNTLVHRTGQYLNQEGKTGFDFVDLLVEPVIAVSEEAKEKEQEAKIYDPEFIQRAYLFEQELGRLPGARETSYILDGISEISLESFKKPLPTEQGELGECFFLIGNSKLGSLQEQLWYYNGVRLSASTRTDDSNDLGDFINSIIILAQSKFPDLKVSAFGKVVVYPRVDRYIRLGKPWNMINSQWVIILFCIILIWWKNKKIKGALRLSPFWGGVIMSVPFVFASAVMILIMIIFKIPLDIATAPFTAFAINASIDFSIYFVVAFIEGLEKTRDKIKAIYWAMQDKGEVIIKDMILNILIFTLLLTSGFLPVKRLGWIMSIMLLACGVGALVIMPAMLQKAVKGGFQDEKVGVHINSHAISLAD